MRCRHGATVTRRCWRVFPADRPLFLPVIVLGEYRFGIQVARDRGVREQWLDSVEQAVTLLEVDRGTACRYAEVREELRRARTPIPENDVWIAGLVRQHDLTLLSRDSHFDRVAGLRRVGW